MSSDMAPLLRAHALFEVAGDCPEIRRRERSGQGRRQLMRQTSRRQSMIGTEVWDIAVSMDLSMLLKCPRSRPWTMVAIAKVARGGRTVARMLTAARKAFL